MNDSGAATLVAFEENRFFIYALGVVSTSNGNSRHDDLSHAPRLIRRFILLKPSVFVIDDHILNSRAPSDWRLYSSSALDVTGRRVHIREAQGDVFCETLLPRSLSDRIVREKDRAEAVLEQTALDSTATRFLHVIWIGSAGRQSTEARSDEVRSDLKTDSSQCDRGCPPDIYKLTVSTGQRTFHLTLPAASEGAGHIAISAPDGQAIVNNRLFPSGILPHGPEGMRALELWDSDYRHDQPPLWDAGQPSGDLMKLVESGAIPPSRALELGSGSGKDSIYLARHGFDVTAIEIAPTALAQAEEKARKAHVAVRWLLADVLAPPDLAPFDFIYDRGCYHVVRDQNLAAYLDTVRRFSRAGTRFLLLAGNANDPSAEYGLPHVSEEELRHDFQPLFDFEWIRESRFEVSRPGVLGPLAWAVLMRRKAGL